MRVSRSAVWLSFLVGALAFVAAAAGLFVEGDGRGISFSVTTLRGQVAEIYGRGLYRWDTVLIGAGFRGVDAITLAVGIPLLIGSAFRYRQGSFRAGILLTGTLGFFLYNYASMALAASYNNLFLLYVALFSASLFAFVLAFSSFDLRSLPSRFSSRLPVRSISIYLFAVGLLLMAVWLSDIVVALAQGGLPAPLAGYTTMVTYVLDLGVVAPTAFLAGALLWRRRPMGYLLSAMMLGLNLTIGLALMAQGGAILLAGVPLSPGQIVGMIVSFAVLSLVGMGFLVALLRSVAPRPPRLALDPPVPVLSGR